MSYYTKITTTGLAAITAAMNSNSKVPIAYMAFGDGNGYIPEPNENANSLVNEIYRTGVNKVEIHNKNPNWLVCEAIIPSSVGGFNIREVALYDNTGTKMLAIASYPPTYKPTVEEGAAKIQTIRIVLQVDNTGNFELVIDPDVILATKEYVDSKLNVDQIKFNNFINIETKLTEFCSAEDFGSFGDGKLHKLSEKYSSLELARFAYANISDQISSLEQSIDWAAITSALKSKDKVHLTQPTYVLNEPIFIEHGKFLIGHGCDVWDFASTTGKTNKMERGTTLLFQGNPTKFVNVFGVTRNSLTGGVIANPSQNETEFPTYELTDFTNQNATSTTPATLRNLKCGVVLNEASNSSLRDIRILKSYNGIEGYNDETLVGVGDDYDIGLLVLNSSFCDFHNVQVVGYWKMFGGVQINSEHKNVGSSKMGEGTFNLYSKCYFQGLTGFGFRGADEHLVISNTSNTFTIPYDSSNLITIGDQLTNGGQTFKVISTSVVNDTLVVTTDSTVPNVGNLLRHVRFNFGVAGVQMRDCVIVGLFHKSRLSAKDLGLSKNSCGLEVSGGILRDIDLDNVHIFDGECIAFINNVDDVNFKGSYFEAYGIKNKFGAWNPSGTRFIVNGETSDSNAKYPIEGCKNLTMDQSTEISATVDMYPYNINRPDRYTDAGLFKPYSMTIDAHGSQVENRFPKSRSETIIKTTGIYPGNRMVRVVDPNFKDILRITENGRVLIGGVASQNIESILHVRSISEDISATHDIINDAPNAGYQLRSRKGTGWLRNWVDSSGYFRWSYSVGQSSSFSQQAFFFNTNEPAFAVNGDIRSTSDLNRKLGNNLQRFESVWASKLMFNATTGIFSGNGSPEGILTAGIGSSYHRLDGSVNSTLYVKESGFGNTGWVAK